MIFVEMDGLCRDGQSLQRWKAFVKMGGLRRDESLAEMDCLCRDGRYLLRWTVFAEMDGLPRDG